MNARIPVALGFRAGKGGSLVVAVARQGGEPRVVLSGFLTTAADGDRQSLEPYQLAYEIGRGSDREPRPEAVALVAEARRRQDALAEQGLADILLRLRGEGCEPARAALLVNRANWITDLLHHALSSPEHPPVIEGLAVREALRFAFGRSDLAVVEMDEKSLPETAAKALGLAPGEIDAWLTALGGAVGRPWRKEQKLACLAAWLAAAGL
jgi:hypothetical protein